MKVMYNDILIYKVVIWAFFGISLWTENVALNFKVHNKYNTAFVGYLSECMSHWFGWQFSFTLWAQENSHPNQLKAYHQTVTKQVQTHSYQTLISIILHIILHYPNQSVLHLKTKNGKNVFTKLKQSSYSQRYSEIYSPKPVNYIHNITTIK